MADTATTPAHDPYSRHIVESFPRKADLDVHVSEIEVEGIPYIDVREYIPSLQAYGRGILLPQALAAKVFRAGLNALPEEVLDA